MDVHPSNHMENHRFGHISLGLPSKNIVLHAESPIFGYVFCPSLCLGEVVLTIWQSNVASREIAQK